LLGSHYRYCEWWVFGVAVLGVADMVVPNRSSLAAEVAVVRVHCNCAPRIRNSAKLQNGWTDMGAPQAVVKGAMPKAGSGHDWSLVRQVAQTFVVAQEEADRLQALTPLHCRLGLVVASHLLGCV
jgi:hypothetical protein